MRELGVDRRYMDNHQAQISENVSESWTGIEPVTF